MRNVGGWACDGESAVIGAILLTARSQPGRWDITAGVPTEQGHGFEGVVRGRLVCSSLLLLVDHAKKKNGCSSALAWVSVEVFRACVCVSSTAASARATATKERELGVRGAGRRGEGGCTVCTGTIEDEMYSAAVGGIVPRGKTQARLDEQSCARTEKTGHGGSGEVGCEERRELGAKRGRE